MTTETLTTLRTMYAARAIRNAALALWVETELRARGSDAWEIAGRLTEAGLLRVAERGGACRVTMHGRTAQAPSLRQALHLWVREMRT